MQLKHAKQNQYMKNRNFITRSGIDFSNFFAKQVKEVAKFNSLPLNGENVMCKMKKNVELNIAAYGCFGTFQNWAYFHMKQKIIIQEFIYLYLIFPIRVMSSRIE